MFLLPPVSPACSGAQSTGVIGYFADHLNQLLEPELLLYPNKIQEAVPWCLVS